MSAHIGPAGVVLGITSYLIGFGVCLHLGAAFGRVWNDWRSGAIAADRLEPAAVPPQIARSRPSQ